MQSIFLVTGIDSSRRTILLFNSYLYLPMKQIILLLFCFFKLSAGAQSGFTRNISIPVNDNGPLDLAWAGGINFPVFSEIDLNNDNTPDLFVFDRSNNRVLTFLNNGGPGTHCWQYAPQYADHFPEMNGWAFLYDYNCDNKPDLFCTNFLNNGISQYRNDSQGGNIIFTLVDSTIKYFYNGPLNTNVIASSYLVPNFVDIDGDGDMDILGQQFQCVGGFAYYKNMSMEDFGNCDSLNDYILVTNSWGDFTLRTGLSKNVVVGAWNVRCLHATNDNSFYEVARRDDTYADIYAIDIDGDGDKDALIGDSQADNSLMVLNGGNTTHATMTSQDTLFPSYNAPVKIHSFSVHSYVDADNDGKKDLIVSQREYEDKSGVYFYKNIGTNSVPNFNYVLNNFLQNEMIDVGESATPVLFDYDGDGLNDLVIGNKLMTTSDTTTVTGLTLYRNTGTLSSPAFEFITDDYAGLHSLHLTGQIFPAFGDIDGDNDIDMILGLDDGHLMYFMNDAGPGVPASFSNPVYPYMSIDVGQASTPQLVDLNKDGMLDLVIGGKNGLVKYFENIGSTVFPVFSSTATNDTLGGINVQTPATPDGYSVPFVFKQGGVTRMLVSSMKGDIYLYGNIDGNIAGNFSILDTVLTKIGGSRYGYNLSVSGGDLNNDTLVDILVGFYGGGVQVYYQDNLTSTASSADNLESMIRVLPNPVAETLIIKSTIPTGRISCTLYDLTGRVILSQPIRGGFTIMDVSGITQGTYLLRIISGKATFSKKVIIER